MNVSGDLSQTLLETGEGKVLAGDKVTTEGESLRSRSAGVPLSGNGRRWANLPLK
jgi:hypothetical protein